MENIGQLTIPNISPVPESAKRQFWSVMIPTCGQSKFLEQTLRSVISQVGDCSDFQVAVVDNTPSSVVSNVDDVIKKIGVSFVNHYKNDSFIGMSENWNRCIELSTGYYVHILHDDDYVAPAFYETMRKAIDCSPADCGLFSCNSYIVTGSIVQKHSRPLEFECGNCKLALLAESNECFAASVAVKRECYERLGGFSPNIKYAADWEMWVRIGKFFSIVALPGFLSYYRIHGSNLTHKLYNAGTATAEMLDLVDLFVSKGIRFNSVMTKLLMKQDIYERYQQACLIKDLSLVKNYKQQCDRYINSIEHVIIFTGILNAFCWIRRLPFYLWHPHLLLVRLKN